MTRRSDILTLGLAGVAACCGISALLATVAGATILGLATEFWALAIVGAVALSALAVRRAVNHHHRLGQLD